MGTIYLAGIVFILLKSLRQLLFINEFTQSGKHSADTHRTEHRLSCGISVDDLDEVELAEGGEVRQQGNQVVVEGENKREG